MAFTEDFAPFFDVAGGFAVTATWNGATSVDGIFDAGYAEPLGNMVEATAPVFMFPTASAVGIKHGDTLVIASTTYKVRGVEPDGTGVTLTRLEAQ